MAYVGPPVLVAGEPLPLASSHAVVLTKQIASHVHTIAKGSEYCIENRKIERTMQLCPRILGGMDFGSHHTEMMTPENCHGSCRRGAVA